MQLLVDIDELDFQQLCESTGWMKDIDPDKAVQRFYRVGRGLKPPRLHWTVVYWLGHSWANVVLARSFLQGIDQDFEIVNDEAMEPNGQSVGLAILTDYKCPLDPLFNGGVNYR